MSKRNRDGSITPVHLPSQSYDNSGNRHYRQFGFYPGDVKTVIYADDKENISGDVEYVVNILGQLYYGVRDIRSSGGIYNSHVRVRKGVDHTKYGARIPSIPKENSAFPEDQDGEAVWCLFIEGNGDFPIIVGSRFHLRREDNPDFKKATKANGMFERYEYNGMEFLIDKDGNFTVGQVGLKDSNSQFPIVLNPEALAPVASKVTFGKNGDLTLSINGAQLSMTFTKATNKCELTAGAGAKIVLDGTGDSITCQTATGSKIKLGAAKVGLGGPGGEVVDLLAQVTDQLIDVATKLSTTMGNLGFPISTAADFTAIINKMVPIKTKIASIKGGI